jgi:hypothetical protein
MRIMMHVTPLAAVDLLADATANNALIEAFALRCWSRDRLYAEGELDLHDAVDVLQEFAGTSGLVATIGQDEVQAIMADAFRPIRQREWQLEDAEQAAPKRNTPPTTIEALMYSLRESGLECLGEVGTSDRLRRCDGPAMKEICGRLEHLNTGSRSRLRNWPTQDIEKLIATWREVGGRP